MHPPEEIERRRAACQAAILRAFDDDLDAVRAALLATADATRLDGDRPENRGERGALSSQGALAGALAARLEQLTADRAAVAALRPGPRLRPGVGAFVEAESEEGDVATWWIAPGASGQRLLPDVLAVSPSAPVGRGWLAAEIGESVVIGPRTWTVVAFR